MRPDIGTTARPAAWPGAPRGQDAVVADPVDVTIALTSDEALFLFDLLHRWEDDEQVSAPRHEAEQIALWNLSAVLERVMADPFRADYERLVSEARNRLSTTD